MQALAKSLLQFGAVHTCKVVPQPQAELLARMDAARIAQQDEARARATAHVGHHVSLLSQ